MQQHIYAYRVVKQSFLVIILFYIPGLKEECKGLPLLGMRLLTYQNSKKRHLWLWQKIVR